MLREVQENSADMIPRRSVQYIAVLWSRGVFFLGLPEYFFLAQGVILR